MEYRVPYTVIPLILLAMMLAMSCSEQDSSKAQLPSKNYEYLDLDFDSLYYWEELLVPAYSDIYHKSGEKRFLLTATLSIRNTDKERSIYIEKVDYLDSDGQLQIQYLKSPINIEPLHAKEFVLEEKEEKGGAGAKFIVKWGCNAPVNEPIVQAVMISTASTQGLSFVTESVIIDHSKELDTLIRQ